MWIGAPSLSAQEALAPLVFFDLLDGTVQPTGTTKDPKITALKNLWYECEVTLVGGNQFWLGFSRAPGTKTDAWSTGTKALAWLQGAEVEQSVVSKWRDRISGRDFAGSGWTWRPSAAEFNGLPALEGNSISFFPPPMRAGEAADWTFLHDGSGATLVTAMRNVSAHHAFHIARTQDYEEGQGIVLGGNDDVSAWEFGASNGKTSLFSVVGGSPTGTKWLAASYGTNSKPQAQLFENGQLVGSANPTSTPASAASEQTLTLGGADSSQQLVSEILVYPRTLDGSEIEQLERYFAPRLGE